MLCFLLQTLPLQVHMKVHSTEKAFSCPECGTGFRHKNSLVRHRWSWHSNIFITAHDPSRWQHQESRPQKCPLCTRQFVAASRLKSHLRAAHTQVSSLRPQTMLIHLKKGGTAVWAGTVLLHYGGASGDIGFKNGKNLVCIDTCLLQC